ncbi:hypothetical protein QE152_g34383 [Popillia japonica]|uniref:Uncharacterized protein n=1 Tax=Popillia japonica TaxID=7064 RepID=A0AAW1IU48_POPJA
MDEEMEAKPAFSEVNTELLAVAVDDAKDFVMQDQSNLDYDDVGHLFDESQDYNKLDHFDEGEGGELYPIMEEGEEMEDIGGMIQTAQTPNGP